MNSRHLKVLCISSFLIGDVAPHGLLRNCPNAADVVAAGPERGHSRFKPRELFSQFVRGEPFELCRKMRGSKSGVRLNEHMNVVRHNFQSVNVGVQFFRFLVQQLPKPFLHRTNQNLEPVFGAPDQVILERVDRRSADAIAGINHEISVGHKLVTCKKLNKRTAFLCPLKRPVPCGF